MSWDDAMRIVQELCAICEMQSSIIREQAAALAQMGAVVAEERRQEAESRYAALVESE